MKEINLTEIIDKYYILDFTDINKIFLNSEVKKAMKEAIKQALELAAENVYCNHEFDGAHGCEYEVNKQSILDTIKQIK